MRAKLWVKNALNYALICIGGSAVYALLMFLMDPEAVVEDLLMLGCVYAIGIGTVMTAILGMMDYKVNLPLCLSFGATRKEAFWGMQLGRGCYGLVMLALVAAVMAPVAGLLGIWVMAPMVLGIIVFMCAVGAVMGMITIRFGKVGGIIAGVTMGLLAMVCGFVIAAGIIAENITVELEPWMLWLLPALAVAVYGVVAPFEWKTVQNYNVKL